MKRIPIAGPWITDHEIQYVTDAVSHAWYADAGMYHDRFERAFAEYLGIEHTISLPSCTSALHLALAALSIKPGDEVIVPDITWIATAAPISYVGAKPVFADIDPQTWCLTADTLIPCLSDRTRAVIAVDLYGSMPPMADLRSMLADRGIPLIEDAAQAIGCSIGGQRAGSFGVASVFSFHGSKTLTTGEGGLLATNSTDLYQRVSFLRDHGRAFGPKQFWNTEVAFKYRMSSMQAALGLAQLERVDELVERKREIFRWYNERLSSIPDLILNAEPDGTVNAYWMVTAIWGNHYNISKEAMIAGLFKEGIDSRPFFYPLSSLPAYANSPDARRAQSDNKTSYRLSPNGVNLPSALCLSEQDVDRVCRSLCLALRNSQ